MSRVDWRLPEAADASGKAIFFAVFEAIGDRRIIDAESGGNRCFPGSIHWIPTRGMAVSRRRNSPLMERSNATLKRLPRILNRHWDRYRDRFEGESLPHWSRLGCGPRHSRACRMATIFGEPFLKETPHFSHVKASSSGLYPPGIVVHRSDTFD